MGGEQTMPGRMFEIDINALVAACRRDGAITVHQRTTGSKVPVKVK